jgi:amino acid adenylation domain-containing protein
MTLSKTNDLSTAKRKNIDLSAEDVFVFPASFAQQRLWLLYQLEPGSPHYNLPAAVRLRGSLNLGALEQSLNEIVRRHESLRTTFAAVDEQPMQVIASALTLDLPVIDLRQLPDFDRETQARKLAIEEALHPFDLVHGPLMRANLLRLDREDHVLLLTMHHIISDEWSNDIFWEEMTTLYKAFCAKEPSPLPDPAIQYADFAQWQRQWLEGEVQEKQLSYWKQQLGGDLHRLQLPTDRLRPAVQTYRGSSQSLVMPQKLADTLKVLGQQEGATMFMTLLAAFKVLLFRYTGQEDILVGTPIANRTRAELERVIGFFVNTLCLRANLSGDPSFRELLGQVREVALDAYSHQDLPFEKLVQELQPERDSSYNPLFQVMFDTPNPSIFPQLPGLSMSIMEIERKTAHFDLTISMTEATEGLKTMAYYNTDLFNAATITRMLEHFQILLEGIAADPDQRLSELPLLTPEERHRLLVEWNDTHADYPNDRCIHQLFEVQVEKTPDAIAASFEDRQMTYRQLNEMANQVGLLLLGRGIGRGSYVPILMGRNIDVAISMLAVMKTGAAFVPLDIDWPTERIKQVLGDLDSEVILVNHTTPFEEEELGRSFLMVDQQVPSNAILNLNVDMDSGEPIYAIYTSGSTGKPKAAVVLHQGITNRFSWMNEFFGVETAAAVLQTTPHIYDSAVWQLFWPLINGGKTVIPSPGMETDADYLSTLIGKQEITITDFVPSVFNTIVPQLVSDSIIRQKLRSLRSIIVGGEEITPGTTYSFMAHFPHVRVINLYGPTEASIGCICYEVTGRENDRIPIGKPISNVHVVIADRDMNPVPVGVGGELYLSGICLGLGYLNDEEKTKAAFVENRFAEIDYSKLYKTGDLARYLPDGNIEFLGRIDHQVKIRGFRIELGEIETVLAQHPAVQQCVTLVREDEPGNKRLVAYILSNQAQAPTISEMASFLKTKLPHYMVPSAFVTLKKFPLTPNGKIDRKALPAPTGLCPELGLTYVAPRTEMERTIASIWQKVLHLEKVGIHDNFFELGGHSLLATQVASRIREILHLEVPLKRFFESPSIASLSIEVEKILIKEIEELSEDEAQRIVEGTA